MNDDAPQDEHESPPIAALADLVQPAPAGFLGRVRASIDRRELGNGLLGLLWYGPVLLLVELLGVLEALMAPGDRDKGGSA